MNKNRISTIFRAILRALRTRPALAALPLLVGLAAAWAMLTGQTVQPGASQDSPQPPVWRWAPALDLPPTPTPFQPVAPTATLLPPTHTPQPTPLIPAASIAAKTDPPQPPSPPSSIIWGIDFRKSAARVTIKITPADKKVNRGQPISISFYPGDTCVFGDHHGCATAYRSPDGAGRIFVSVHSGVGGEAQAYRNALEGTGLNQAGYTLAQIRSNLQALNGAAVTITQGDVVASGLVLAINGRVPSQWLEDYFAVPIDQALARAAEIDLNLKPAVSSSEPELVIETCGWKVREEPWKPGVTSTSASIYLGVIRKH